MVLHHRRAVVRLSMHPPPFISSERPLRTEPLRDPPVWVTCDPPHPNRVGPSHPPIDFVDENGYTVFLGVRKAKDCALGSRKVMTAWGTGDKRVVVKVKNLALLFNARLSGEQAKDPAFPLCCMSKGALGQGEGCPFFKKFCPPPPFPPVQGVVDRGDLHMTPGSVIVVNVGTGHQDPTRTSPHIPSRSLLVGGTYGDAT